MPGTASWCSLSSATRRPAGGGARNTCSRTSRRRWATRCSTPTPARPAWSASARRAMSGSSSRRRGLRTTRRTCTSGGTRSMRSSTRSAPCARSRPSRLRCPRRSSAPSRRRRPCRKRTSGEGEAETLRRITVNTGRIEGGIGVNTIPDRARALCDIRIPPGVTVDRVRAELASAIDPQP